MSVLVTVVVGFVLSPFYVHRLGDSAYGVWVLISSAVGYMALLDFGLRGAIVQFIAKSHASADHENASSALSGAFLIRLAICGVIVLASVGLALLINRVFQIPPELQGQASVVMVLTGLTLAITLACGVFGGVLFHSIRRAVCSTPQRFCQFATNHSGWE
jgi:O-antigen/teichoic acid export membrane protein